MKEIQKGALNVKKDEIIDVLKEIEGEVKQKFKASMKGIFGSYVKGEEHVGSDVDVLVEFEMSADLIDFVGLSLFLEEKLGLKVDVVPYDALRTEIKEKVLKEAIYL